MHHRHSKTGQLEGRGGIKRQHSFHLLLRGCVVVTSGWWKVTQKINREENSRDGPFSSGETRGEAMIGEQSYYSAGHISFVIPTSFTHKLCAINQGWDCSFFSSSFFFFYTKQTFSNWHRDLVRFTDGKEPYYVQANVSFIAKISMLAFWTGTM